MGGPPVSELIERVRACGSSFYWGVRLLPASRREAMAALYLFCRAVDDIVDEPGTAEDKRAGLEMWRASIEAPAERCPDPLLGRALADGIETFGLPTAEFHAIVDGMAMDLPPGCIAPDEATFRLYCRRVAGAVGLLSVRIFGCTGGGPFDAFAIATGDALQITNILRDVAEDAAEGRLYLPREALLEAGIDSTDPQEVLAHPALPEVLDRLARRAEARYADALALARDPALSAGDRRCLRPGLVMLGVYRLLLRRLRQRGWQSLDRRPRLGRLRMAGTVLRWRLFGA